MLKDEVLFAWWTLSSIPGIGSIALNKIREQLPTSSDLINHSAEDLIAFGLKPERAHEWQRLQASTDQLNPFVYAGWQKIKHWCQQPDCGVLMPDEQYYPDALSILRDAPIFLLSLIHI